MKTKNKFDSVFSSVATKNMFWLFSDKIIRLSLGLIIMIWMARYFGPSQFGTFNLAVAIVTIAIALSSMGLNGVVVRDLTDGVDDENKILVTAFFISFLSSIFTYLLLSIFAFTFNPNGSLFSSLLLILGVTIIFRSTQVLRYWFEAKIKAKYVVLVECLIFFMIMLVKALLMYFSFSIVAIAVASIIESILVSILLFYVYKKLNKTSIDWKINIHIAKKLLRDSWPLIISASAWILYLRTDQLLIGYMLGNESVGYYSAAVQLVEALNVIPVIIAFSIIPGIAKLRSENRRKYDRKFQEIYSIVFLSMFLICALTFSFSSLIVITLYGEAYKTAGPILAIYIWTVIFVAMAVVSGRYLLNDGKQKITMKRHLIGVALNIPVSIVFIKFIGVTGAAMGSLITLVVVNFFLDALSAQTRCCFKHKINSIMLAGVLWNRNKASMR